MVEFRLAENPMYHAPIMDDEAKIEKPIVPINELGSTVPESDPRTGADILRNIEASIRQGASKLQVMWMTSGQQPIGGGAKAYGKEVRQAIRELLTANKIDMIGFEMPTSTMAGLSGFDPRRGVSEEKRMRDIQEVKEAIDFAVDTAGGGGIDIWSNEFNRDITDASWNNDKKSQFYDYSPKELLEKKKIADAIKKGEKPEETDLTSESVKYLVDKRSGQIIQSLKKNQVFNVPKYMTAAEVDKVYGTNYVGKEDEARKKATGSAKILPTDDIDVSGHWLDLTNTDDQSRRVPKWDAKNERFEIERQTWNDIEVKTAEHNKRVEKDKQLAPEEFAFRLQVENQILQMRGQASYYNRGYDEGITRAVEAQKTDDALREVEKKLAEGRLSKEAADIEKHQIIFRYTRSLGPEAPADANKLLSVYENNKELFAEQAAAAQRQLRHVQEAAVSYDAKAQELEEMRTNVTTPERALVGKTVQSYVDLGIYAWKKSNDPKCTRPVHVGPELGWPTGYGGHPVEFVRIITDARDEMAKKLHEEYKMKEEDAKKLAKTHIKGMFDTAHLAMWYNHFAAKDGESEEARLKRFNTWYMDQVEYLQKNDVLGGVQVVDSITGQHSHLPVGQGIFPTVESVKKLREMGFKGGIVSEGHEEERFGQGRILTETWRSFGSPIGTSYLTGGPAPRTFGGVQGSYFGSTLPPSYITQAYVPVNDFTLWSEVPFE